MKTLLLLPILFMSLLVACAKPDSTNLEDKAKREIEVENENLRSRAKELEHDLERRQRLFTAVKGTYEGTFVTSNREFKKRITLVPSLPPYEAGRTRTLDELTADLNNLYFTVQSTTLTADNNTVVSGCILSEVRPDYDGGQINAASENCTNIYMMSLYDSTGESSDLPFLKPGVPYKSQEMAKMVLEKKISKVHELFMEMHPTLSEKSFLMILKRIPQK